MAPLPVEELHVLLLMLGVRVVSSASFTPAESLLLQGGNLHRLFAARTQLPWATCRAQRGQIVTEILALCLL